MKNTKIFMLGLLVAALLMASNLQAAPTPATGTPTLYDLTTAGSSVQINGAVFEAYNSTTATGSGVFEAFLRVGGKACSVGYNTDGTREYDTKGGAHTHSVQVNKIPIVTLTDHPYPGTYWELQLDLNQSGSSPLISIDEVEIWVTENPSLTGYPFGSSAAKVWELDNAPSSINNYVKLDARLSAGSGKRDMKLYIPYNSLKDYTTKYLVLYVEHGMDPDGSYPDTGGDFPNNGGFQEWGYAKYNIAKVSGFKWHDLNADGIWDTDEPGLPNWTINAYEGSNLVGTTVTDEYGYYEFILDTPKNQSIAYTISEELKSNWFQSYPSAPGTHTVNLSTGDDIMDTNFGNYQYATISGYKWEDLNADGCWDEDEPALEDWLIELYNNNILVADTTTDANGYYEFVVTPGTYDIAEEQFINGACSYPDVNGVYEDVTVTSGQECDDKDFGNYEFVEITACKLADIDFDPDTTDDQLPVSGWAVSLYCNEVLIDTQLTGADGCYTWSGLIPGYIYGVEEEEREGWEAMTPTYYEFDSAISGDVFLYEFINHPYVWCEETAFAYNEEVSNCFSDFGFDRWGWTNLLTGYGTYDFDIYAGAGQCDLDKGVYVGTLEVTFDSSGVSVTDLYLEPGYQLVEVHFYAGDTTTPIVKQGKKNVPTVAPGQYYNAGDVNNDQEVYIIFHTVVGWWE